jgi:hypothetical protein
MFHTGEVYISTHLFWRILGRLDIENISILRKKYLLIYKVNVTFMYLILKAVC